MKQKILPVLYILSLYLGLYKEYLALWNTEKERPEQVFPYHISLYPEIDKNLLEKGIPIATESELNKLLEDYLS